VPRLCHAAGSVLARAGLLDAGADPRGARDVDARARRQWAHATPTTPSAGTVRDHLGNWNAAIEAAARPVRRRRGTTATARARACTPLGARPVPRGPGPPVRAAGTCGAACRWAPVSEALSASCAGSSCGRYGSSGQRRLPGGRCVCVACRRSAAGVTVAINGLGAVGGAPPDCASLRVSELVFVVCNTGTRSSVLRY
jgi:hypothetical protein